MLNNLQNIQTTESDRMYVDKTIEIDFDRICLKGH